MVSSHSSDSVPSISSTMLARIKLHDDGAWNELFAVWHPVVYDWCRRARLSPDDSEDVAQNVLLRVARSISRFQHQSFRGWIRCITRNTILQHFRDTARVPVAFGGTGSWVGKIPDSDAQEPWEPDTNCSPDCEEPAPEQTDQLILGRLLQVIHNDFEEKTFQAFWRTKVDGQSAVEVAEELEMTPEAVRAACYRVRKRLLAEQDGMLAGNPDFRNSRAS